MPSKALNKHTFKGQSWQSWLTFLLLTLVYRRASGNTIAFGDPAALLAEAFRGFSLSTNATNHNVFVNLIHGLHALLPAVPIHALALWLVAAAAAGSMVLMHRIMIMRGCPSNVAFWFTAVFAFSYTWGRQAVIAEVYTVTFFGILWWVKSLLHSWGKYKLFWLSAGLGLLLWLHIQAILLIPALLWYAFAIHNKSLPQMAAQLWPIALAVIGLMALPLVTGLHPVSMVFFEQVAYPVEGSFFFKLAKNTASAIAFALFNFWLVVLAFKLKSNEEVPYVYRISTGLLVLPFLGFALIHFVSDSYVFQLGWYFMLAVAFAPLIQFRNWINKGAEWKMAALVAVHGFIIPATLHLPLKQIPQVKAINESWRFKGGIYYHSSWWMVDKRDLLEATHYRKAIPSQQLPMHDSLYRYEEWRWSAEYLEEINSSKSNK